MFFEGDFDFVFHDSESECFFWEASFLDCEVVVGFCASLFEFCDLFDFFS